MHADYCVHHEFMGDDLYEGLHGQMIREYSKELIDTRELVFKEPKDFEIMMIYPKTISL